MSDTHIILGKNELISLRQLLRYRPRTNPDGSAFWLPSAESFFQLLEAQLVKQIQGEDHNG